jgi:hypothetical protein
VVAAPQTFYGSQIEARTVPKSKRRAQRASKWSEAIGMTVNPAKIL